MIKNFNFKLCFFKGPIFSIGADLKNWPLFYKLAPKELPFSAYTKHKASPKLEKDMAMAMTRQEKDMAKHDRRSTAFLMNFIYVIPLHALDPPDWPDHTEQEEQKPLKAA